MSVKKELKNKRIRLKTTRKKGSKLKRIYECIVCTENVQIDDTVKCTNQACNTNKKGFRLCKECFNDGLKSDINSNKFPLRCISCEHEISLNKIKFEDKKLEHDIYKKHTLALYKKTFPESRECYGKYCINIIKKDECDKNHEYICEFCDGHYCFFCGDPHPNLSCQKNMERNKNDLKFHALVHDPRSFIHPCPFCFIPTQKTNCDYVTCLVCKNPWDWKLGRVRSKEGHTSKPNEARTYRVPGDINQQSGEVYREYMENVADG